MLYLLRKCILKKRFCTVIIFCVLIISCQQRTEVVVEKNNKPQDENVILYDIDIDTLRTAKQYHEQLKTNNCKRTLELIFQTKRNYNTKKSELIDLMYYKLFLAKKKKAMYYHFSIEVEANDTTYSVSLFDKNSKYSKEEAKDKSCLLLNAKGEVNISGTVWRTDLKNVPNYTIKPLSITVPESNAIKTVLVNIDEKGNYELLNANK